MVCLDMRTHRATDSISRRGKGVGVPGRRADDVEEDVVKVERRGVARRRHAEGVGGVDVGRVGDVGLGAWWGQWKGRLEVSRQRDKGCIIRAGFL